MSSSLPAARDVELRVISLGGLGDGIAELNDAPVFVPKTLPGDNVRARLLHTSGDGIRAELLEIITASDQRGKAECAHFEDCGGCTLQHMQDGAYTAFKFRRATDALRQAGFDASLLQPMVRFDAPTRRRVEFRLIHGEKSTVAFQALHRHRKVAITRCEVLAPQLQNMLELLSKTISSLPQREQIEGLKLTLADNGVDAIFCITTAFAEDLRTALAQHDLPVIRLGIEEAGRYRCLTTQTLPVVHCGNVPIILPPDAFLQATKQAQDFLTHSITQWLDDTDSIADLFAGIGVYGFALSAGRRFVVLYESHPEMVHASRQAIATHKLLQMQAHARDLFKSPLTARELSAYKGIVINPPRTGAKAQCAEIARSTAQKIAMVSCNPASFARDAKILREAGYRLASAQAIDQFRWTAHLEMLALFERL